MVARAPRKRMYRSMQGRMIDIEKLRAANENVRAVGNMDVNARGDQIGPGGKVIKTKEQVVAKYYEAPKGVVDDTPARSKPTPAPRQENAQVMTPTPQPKAVQSKPAPRTRQTKPKTATAPKKGIDAALDGLE
jgi:hypothetical protein